MPLAAVSQPGVVHVIPHPDVVIDPAIPIPDWPLSARGRDRMSAALDLPWMRDIRALFTSAERKATDAAGIIALSFGLVPVILADLGENDRSATGYLAKPEFEATADAFFAHPHDSIRGWERAIDAQSRIVAALTTIVGQLPRTGDVAIMTHGAVAALFRCHLQRAPISRSADQPGAAGGNRYAFDPATMTLLTPWHSIDDPAPIALAPPPA